MVELGRLELPTSCMPCKRSSQLSYSPMIKLTFKLYNSYLEKSIKKRATN